MDRLVADTGDGFNATYSIAWLAAQRQLRIDGLDRTLPRAGLLVLGGDEVYPAASPTEYDNRFKGPYKASLPHTQLDSPMLVAIPETTISTMASPISCGCSVPLKTSGSAVAG